MATQTPLEDPRALETAYLLAKVNKLEAELAVLEALYQDMKAKVEWLQQNKGRWPTDG